MDVGEIKLNLERRDINKFRVVRESSVTLYYSRKFDAVASSYNENWRRVCVIGGVRNSLLQIKIKK